MRDTKDLAPHELIHLHEVMLAETTGAFQLQHGLQYADDNQMKQLMQTAIQTKMQRISKMQQFVSRMTGNQLQ